MTDYSVKQISLIFRDVPNPELGVNKCAVYLELEPPLPADWSLDQLLQLNIQPCVATALMVLQSLWDTQNGTVVNDAPFPGMRELK